MDILMSTPKYICSIRTKKTKRPPSPSHTWHWQPFGTPRKVPAIYPPLTLSVAGHRSLLGKQGVSSYKVVVRKFRTTSGGQNNKEWGSASLFICTNTFRYASVSTSMLSVHKPHLNNVFISSSHPSRCSMRRSM